MIQTKRCFIRDFSMDDLEDVYRYSSNPKIGPMAGWRPHESQAETYQTLKTFVMSNEIYAIVDKTSRHVIGSIGVHPDRKRDDPSVRMIGYVLDEPYWGQGYMVEVVNAMIKQVFTKTNIQMLSIYHFPFNHQSKRVIEKCGFKFEGVLRNGSKLYNGAIYDDYCYSMSRQEYLLLNKSK